MKETITFERATLAMLKSTLIEYLEIRAFCSDCIDIGDSIFRKKLKLSVVRSAVSPTKYGTIEPKRGERKTLGDAYVKFPTPGRKNHYKDVTLVVDVSVDAISEKDLTEEFKEWDDLKEIRREIDVAVAAVQGEIAAMCRMEIVKFGNVWSSVSVTATIDGRREWNDFLASGCYDTSEFSLSREAKIDESRPEFEGFLAL